MQRLSRQSVSESFYTVGLRPDRLPLGHVLSIDHFHMAEPTFPPHPHAGFSAVTWMLPWSEGAFINRDSRGDRSRIGAGDLHWTRAASGMLHEEIPETPGVDCEGLQIFVKLPESAELLPPAAFHLTAEQVPVLVRPGGRVRVLAGEVEGVASPIADPSGTTLAHASVTGQLILTVPADVEAFVMVLRGAGRIADQPAVLHEAASLGPGPVSLQGDGLEALVGWSPRLPERPAFQGPFCMFQAERLAHSFQRYRGGAMGELAPSPVEWARPAPRRRP